MNEIIKQELRKLIEEGEDLSESIKIKPPTPNIIHLNTNYYVDNLQRMHNWIDLSETIIKKYFDSEYKSLPFSSTSLKNDHSKLLSKLKTSFRLSDSIPNYNIKVEDKVNASGNIININNSQTQSQEQKQEQLQIQKILLEVFLEAIKDELSGKQQKEIQSILEEYESNIEEAKPKLMEKLASFGTNVLAGIVGNILTNPAMLGLF